MSYKGPVYAAVQIKLTATSEEEVAIVCVCCETTGEDIIAVDVAAAVVGLEITDVDVPTIASVDVDVAATEGAVDVPMVRSEIEVVVAVLVSVDVAEVASVDVSVAYATDATPIITNSVTPTTTRCAVALTG